eukprot:scaffold685_cov281-Pinguiococcus_pyrenoidosus.AAC.12
MAMHADSNMWLSALWEVGPSITEPRTSSNTPWFSPTLSMTSNGSNFESYCTSASLNSRPIKRLTSNTVLVGFEAAWF